MIPAILSIDTAYLSQLLLFMDIAAWKCLAVVSYAVLAYVLGCLPSIAGAVPESEFLM